MIDGATEPVVLLVADDPDDVRVVREVVGDGRAAADLRVVSDGSDALAYLRECTEEGSVPPPDLVLLDASIPNADGRSLLESIKTDPALARVPVIVLSHTAADEEAVAFYRRYANAVLRKPADPSAFADVLRPLEHFWLSTARLPGRNG